jgi:hypothetical protein
MPYRRVIFAVNRMSDELRAKSREGVSVGESHREARQGRRGAVLHLQAM